MRISEDLLKSGEPTIRVLRPREDFDRARRVERAIDNAGHVIQKPQSFVRLASPDGSVWRVKVSNTGALSAVKE